SSLFARGGSNTVPIEHRRRSDARCNLLNVKDRERFPAIRDHRTARTEFSAICHFAADKLDDKRSYLWRPRFSQATEASGPVKIFRSDIHHEQLVLRFMEDMSRIGDQRDALRA